jgi:HAD superfamily hydrolase (TIGR01509 family)
MNQSASSMIDSPGLQAVIFDVDGLLIDTETCDYEAWRELYAAHGIDLTLADFCHTAGLYGSWERAYEELSSQVGVPAEELHARREPRFRELVQNCLAPSPELLRLLDEVEAAGVALGVASSSDSDWVAYLLEGLGIRDRFRAVATGHDVEHRKPAPDVYLLAAQRLGVDPRRCVALEDSVHGIEAAQAAGMRVVVIPNPISVHQDLTRADARVQHFGEVTVELLTSLTGPSAVPLGSRQRSYNREGDT